MTKPRVLIEGSEPFTLDASDLVLAAQMKPVRAGTKGERIDKILHEIEMPETRSVAEIVKRVRTEAKKALSQHRDRRIVFCLPTVPAKKYVQLVAELGELELAKDAPMAVACILQDKRAGTSTEMPRQFILDSISRIDTLGDDLRDNRTGKLDAKKVGELFGIKIPAIAEAVGVSRQSLNDNPVSEKAQPVLKHFERVARLRSMPQFKEPADFRKWFKRPLPVFSNKSAEDLFKEGELETVAGVVDQLLTGDFGG